MKWAILALIMAPGLAWAQSSDDYGQLTGQAFLMKVSGDFYFIKMAAAANHCGFRSKNWRMAAYQFILDGVNGVAEDLWDGEKPPYEKWAVKRFTDEAYRADVDGDHMDYGGCRYVKLMGPLDYLDEGIDLDPAAARAERTGKTTLLPMLQAPDK